MFSDKALRPFLGAILVIAAFILGAIAGNRSDDIGDAAQDLVGGGDAEVTSEALDVIQDSYFEEVEADQLDNASVRGMVAEIKRQYKDRFSHYFGPEAYEEFRQVTEGSFSGVGMSVTGVQRGLRVARTFDESPAKEAGIREGDIVTEVEGKPIAGQDADLATAEIKGEAGTEVTITVLRPSSGEKREVTMTREELSVPVVEGKLLEADGVPVAYVELLSFSRGAHGQLKQEIERLDEAGAQGLVLDLRGNGGGLLEEAVLTSSLFVEDGVIVSTEGRASPKQTFEAVGDALPERPTVVLINGDTASASEILTAALSDAGLATIVGEKSFGKGTFQEVIELENGGALDLTVGEYLTRDGDSINGIGIKPEVPARDRPATKPDEGLNQALSALGAALSGSN
jgi:carboxyl-terminal processing protease